MKDFFTRVTILREGCVCLLVSFSCTEDTLALKRNFFFVSLRDGALFQHFTIGARHRQDIPWRRRTRIRIEVQVSGIRATWLRWGGNGSELGRDRQSSLEAVQIERTNSTSLPLLRRSTPITIFISSSSPFAAASPLTKCRRHFPVCRNTSSRERALIAHYA
jgi:hypothetical protein